MTSREASSSDDVERWSPATTTIPTPCWERIRDNGGVVVRAFRPARGGASSRAGREPVELQQMPRRPACSRASRGRPLPLQLPARGRLRRRWQLHDRRPLPVPADARRARPPPGRRRAATSSCTSARRARARDRRRSRHRVRGLGAHGASAVSVVGDFNSWDGRLHPMRSLGALRDLGAVRPGRGRGRPLQVRDPRPGRRLLAEGRPVRHSRPSRRRTPPRSSTRSASRVARRRVARAPARERSR